MKGVLPEDCIFLIDYDQNPELTFLEDAEENIINKSILKAEDSDITEMKMLTKITTEQKKIDRTKKSPSEREIARLDSLKKFINQFSAARKNADLNFDPQHMKCTEKQLLVALKKWAKKRDKETQILWDIKRLSNLDIWPHQLRQQICILPSQGEKHIVEKDFFEIVGF